MVEDILAQSTNAASDNESPQILVEHIANQISGFGLLQPLLDDPSVEEIWINEPGRIFVARNGKSELTSVILSDVEVRGLVERMLASSGTAVTVTVQASPRTAFGYLMPISTPVVVSAAKAINKVR
jgi:pilus assembly protein CpaF